MSKESNLVSFARGELARLVKPGDEMQAEMNKSVLVVVRAFSEAGHSGFSAGYALGILNRLLAFKPLGPLTGDDDEWVEVGAGILQNKRRSTVFRDLTGPLVRDYDIEGKVFRDPDGSCWSNGECHVDITFPYVVPEHPEVVDRPWEWPEDCTLEDGRVLFMEGNITSTENPFTVGLCRSNRAKGEPAIWSREFSTFYAAHDHFDRMSRGSNIHGIGPDTAEPREEFPVEGEIKTTGGNHSEDPVPFGDN